MPDSWTQYASVPDWFDFPFLARLTSVQAGSGAYANVSQYGFVEQQFDVASSIPSDIDNPRTDNLATAGTSFAVERNNMALTVPGSTPPGYPAAGPYVEMRFRGIVNGDSIYEFDAPASPASTLLSGAVSVTGVSVTTGSFSFINSGWSVLAGSLFTIGGDGRPVINTTKKFLLNGYVNWNTNTTVTGKVLTSEVLLDSSVYGSNSNNTMMSPLIAPGSGTWSLLQVPIANQLNQIGTGTSSGMNVYINQNSGGTLTADVFLFAVEMA